MTARGRLKRGIELTLAGGNKVVFDGNGPGDVAVLSHAHRDVTFDSHPLAVINHATEFEPGDAVVFPARAKRHPIVQSLLVRSDTVYTHHGSTDSFAAHPTRDYGYHAQALKQNQATLDEF